MGLNLTLSSDAKKPQTRLSSCGSISSSEFAFDSLSMIPLPNRQLLLNDQYFEQFILKLMSDASNPVLERNHGRKFRRKGAYAG